MVEYKKIPEDVLREYKNISMKKKAILMLDRLVSALRNGEVELIEATTEKYLTPRVYLDSGEVAREEEDTGIRTLTVEYLVKVTK